MVGLPGQPSAPTRRDAAFREANPVFRKFLESVQQRLTKPAPGPSATSSRAPQPAQAPNPWHAVSIQGGEGGRCEAARALAGRRFLSGDAPALPLPDCDRPDTCHCRYRKHGDRRTSGQPLDRNGIPLPHPNRREVDF